VFTLENRSRRKREFSGGDNGIYSGEMFGMWGAK